MPQRLLSTKKMRYIDEKIKKLKESNHEKTKKELEELKLEKEIYENQKETFSKLSSRTVAQSTSTTGSALPSELD